MASPKKKWLRMKAVEDAAKAEAEVAETVRQLAKEKVVKQVTEAKVAATKVSVKRVARRRRPPVSED